MTEKDCCGKHAGDGGRQVHADYRSSVFSMECRHHGNEGQSMSLHRQRRPKATGEGARGEPWVRRVGAACFFVVGAGHDYEEGRLEAEGVNMATTCLSSMAHDTLVSQTRWIVVS